MKHSIISHSLRRKSLQKEIEMTAYITYKANSLDDTNKDSVKRSLIKTCTNEVIETFCLFQYLEICLQTLKQICPKVSLL